VHNFIRSALELPETAQNTGTIKIMSPLVPTGAAPINRQKWITRLIKQLIIKIIKKLIEIFTVLLIKL